MPLVVNTTLYSCDAKGTCWPARTLALEILQPVKVKLEAQRIPACEAPREVFQRQGSIGIRPFLPDMRDYYIYIIYLVLDVRFSPDDAVAGHEALDTRPQLGFQELRELHGISRAKPRMLLYKERISGKEDFFRVEPEYRVFLGMAFSYALEYRRAVFSLEGQAAFEQDDRGLDAVALYRQAA